MSKGLTIEQGGGGLENTSATFLKNVELQEEILAERKEAFTNSHHPFCTSGLLETFISLKVRFSQYPVLPCRLSLKDEVTCSIHNLLLLNIWKQTANSQTKLWKDMNFKRVFANTAEPLPILSTLGKI